MSWMRADHRAYPVPTVGLPEKVGIRIPSEDAHEGGLRPETRDLQGEVRRVPSREGLECGDVTLEISARKGAHRGSDPINDRVTDRDHAAYPAGHSLRPSRVPAASILRRRTCSRPDVRSWDRRGYRARPARGWNPPIRRSGRGRRSQP